MKYTPSRVALSFSVLLIVFCQPSNCILNCDPFRTRDLFKIELRIGEVIQKLRPMLQPHHEQLKKDVNRSNNTFALLYVLYVYLTTYRRILTKYRHGNLMKVRVLGFRILKDKRSLYKCDPASFSCHVSDSRMT